MKIQSQNNKIKEVTPLLSTIYLNYIKMLDDLKIELNGDMNEID